MRSFFLLFLAACSSSTVVSAPPPGSNETPADGTPSTATPSAPATPVTVMKVADDDNIDGFALTDTEMFVSARKMFDVSVALIPFAGGATRFLGAGSVKSWVATLEIVVDDGFFHWSDGALVRTPTAGGADEVWVPPLEPGASPSDDIVKSGDALYTCQGDQEKCTLIRVDLATKKVTNIADVPSESRWLRATDARVAWTDGETIFVRDTKVVSFPVPKPSRAHLQGFALSGDAIYVAVANENTFDGAPTGGTVKRVSFDGNDAKVVYESTADTPGAVTADGQSVWIEEQIHENGYITRSRLLRVPTTGGDATTLVEDVQPFSLLTQDAKRVFYLTGAGTDLERLDK